MFVYIKCKAFYNYLMNNFEMPFNTAYKLKNTFVSVIISIKGLYLFFIINYLSITEIC